MEMPVPCDKCREWVELNDTRESQLDKGKMLCRECYSEESPAKCLIEEAKNIQLMLDNDDEDVRGNRRSWKRRIKEIKSELKELGFDYGDYQY